MQFFKSLTRSLTAKSLAVAMAVSLAPATLPGGTQLFGAAPANAQIYGGNVVLAGGHFRGHRGGFYRHRGFGGHRGYYGGRRYYGHRRHHGIGSGGAAVLGGIIGLGVGAAIASQPRYYEPAPRYYRAAPRVVYGAPPFRSRAWYRYCEARFRSFDPRSGTYQPYHGPRRVCR